MFITPNFYAKAIENLLPEGTGFAMAGAMTWEYKEDSQGNPYEIPTNIELFKEVTLPTRKQIEEEVSRLEAEWKSTEYQRQRKFEYPGLEVLADALYWQQQGDNTKMEAYLAAVDAVKNKYPKV